LYKSIPISNSTIELLLYSEKAFESTVFKEGPNTIEFITAGSIPTPVPPPAFANEEVTIDFN
jgi:hypothetical protein